MSRSKEILDAVAKINAHSHPRTIIPCPHCQGWIYYCPWMSKVSQIFTAISDERILALAKQIEWLPTRGNTWSIKIYFGPDDDWVIKGANLKLEAWILAVEQLHVRGE